MQIAGVQPAYPNPSWKTATSYRSKPGRRTSRAQMSPPITGERQRDTALTLDNLHIARYADYAASGATVALASVWSYTTLPTQIQDCDIEFSRPMTTVPSSGMLLQAPRQAPWTFSWSQPTRLGTVSGWATRRKVMPLCSPRHRLAPRRRNATSPKTTSTRSSPFTERRLRLLRATPR